MNKVSSVVVLIILMLAACSPQAAATELPPVIEDPATQVGDDLTPAQQAAIAELARNLGLPEDRIKITSTEALEWPDSCFGISMEDTACAEVITPGYRVILEVHENQVEYRTDEEGTVILPATPALTWERVGGIAGFCDNIKIYLSGEITATNCNAGKVTVGRLSDLLSAEEIAMLNEWISTYGEVEIDASDPKGVSDRMTVNLKLFGTGNEPLTSTEVEQTLLQFAQALHNKLMTQ
jgi:hypothetical protein